MAQDGELSADVVKQAVFAATDEINANFENIDTDIKKIFYKANIIEDNK